MIRFKISYPGLMGFFSPENGIMEYIMSEGINGSADLLHIQRFLLIYFMPVKGQLLQYNPYTLDLMHSSWKRLHAKYTPDLHPTYSKTRGFEGLE